MTDELPSVIVAQEAAAAAQPLLFSELRDEAYEKLEATGEFTGERLAERNPEKYRLVVELITEGVLAEAQIAKACRVSRNTVRAVREREKIPVEQVKVRIKANIREALLASSERVMELAPTMSARDAVIAVGVLSEKMQLLDGEATAIVGTVGDKVRHADFNDLVESLPAADAHVVEMGSPSGTEGQKGGLGGPAALGDRRPEVATGDYKSPVCAGTGPEGNGYGNSTPGNRADLEGSADQGGRGSAEGEGGQ